MNQEERDQLQGAVVDLDDLMDLIKGFQESPSNSSDMGRSLSICITKGEEMRHRMMDVLNNGCFPS